MSTEKSFNGILRVD